jgi:hypothetical protein
MVAAAVLAASLFTGQVAAAVATQGTAEDIPAVVVAFQPDEDAWQNPVTPVLATNVSAYLPDADEILGVPPTVSLDEDFWQNPVAPIIAANGPLYLPDADEIVIPVPIQDEDFWQNPVAPILASNYQSFPYLPDTEEPIFAPAHVQDEDFWQGPAPAQAQNLLQLPLGDVEADVPAGSFHGQADEDFQWPTLTAPPWPAQANNVLRLPYLPDAEEIVVAVPAPPTVDEDFWQNPAPPTVAANLSLYLPDADEVWASTPQLEEEFWVNLVAPVVAANQSLYLPDAEEIPAGALHGQPDEDFWQNPVAPIQAANYQRLPYLPDTEEPTVIPPAPLVQDEDFWQNLVAPVPAQNSILLPLGDVETDGPAGSLYGQPDEDFWANPVAPIATTNKPLYLPDADEIIVLQPVAPIQDEDFWQSIVTPVPAQNFLRLPLGDVETDIPANQQDEDFWQNPTAPIPAGNGRLYWWPNDEDQYVGPPLAIVYEIPWQNLVAPVIASNQLLYLPDGDEILTFTFDEDFWQNPVAPVVASNRTLYLPDADEIRATPQLEEEFWQNWVAPIQNIPVAQALSQWQWDVPEPAGALYGQPDEDFPWPSPTLPPFAVQANPNPQAIPQWTSDVQEVIPSTVVIIVNLQTRLTQITMAQRQTRLDLAIRPSRILLRPP